MNDKEGRKWLLQKLYDNGIKYIAYSPFYGGYLYMDFYQISMSRIISILASIWVLLTGARWL